MLEVMLLSQYRHPKPSDLVLRVVPDVWGTLLERGLRFVQCTDALLLNDGWRYKMVLDYICAVRYCSSGED